jgi:hypothetical protein
MKKRYKSELLRVLYEDAVADFEVGGISAERMKFKVPRSRSSACRPFGT